MLHVFSLKQAFNESMFLLNGSDVLLCAEAFQETGFSNSVFFTDPVESYLTFVGSLLSIISLISTLVVYLSFKELLNIPGKILVCLIISLLVAHIIFMVSGHVENLTHVCKMFAATMHYFFLASFSWMNVVAFDLLVTFSRPLVASAHSIRSNRFRIYCLYAWLAPFSVVCTAAILEYTYAGVNIGFKPNYGERVCWISNSKALIIFFLIPLGACKVFDIIAFICTSLYICTANRKGSKIRSRKVWTFLLYLKLSFVMGLTWAFAFISVFAKSIVMWYLFIFFNSLQGVFIAASFLFSQKTRRLLRQRFMKSNTGSASRMSVSSTVTHSSVL
jgi:hypothetical protein